MQWSNVCIESLGYLLPPHVVSSQQLEQAIGDTLRRIGLPSGQLEELTGVKERRWWDPGTQPSDVAAQAGQRALERAGKSPGDVDLLVNTSVCRDYLEPATAALVGGRIGVPRTTMCFDVANACLGFLNGMTLAANMIELGQIQTALIVDGESSREPVTATLERLASPQATSDDLRANFATLTLGSGAVAAVLTHRDQSAAGHRLHGMVQRSATEHSRLCLGNPSEMQTDSQALMTHGIQLCAETLPHWVREMGWPIESVDEFVCHQVGLTHVIECFSAMNLPLDKALLTFPQLGNVGPASLPLTLALGEEQGRVVAGKRLCLFGIGSGLGVMAMGVTW